MEATTQGHWRVTHEGWIVEVSQGWETPAPVYGGSEEQVLAEAQSKITIELGGELRAEWVEEVAMQATETKHTPGPNCDDCGCRFATGFISRCPLHAAAPELLAALRAVVSMHCVKLFVPGRGDTYSYRDYCGEMNRARAAIAKAEGR